jgi:outer membrane murein-binding lipoprotein Lpp
MTPAELVARIFAAYENGGTMTESEFVKKVLDKYEVWDGEPTPSFEVVLEWIERDRLEARDYVEWRGRCIQAEAKLDERETEVGTLIAHLARRDEQLATARDDFRHSERGAKEWRARASKAEAELARFQRCSNTEPSGVHCWFDTVHQLHHEAMVYHKVEMP